jgi:hypothetical protein
MFTVGSSFAPGLSAGVRCIEVTGFTSYHPLVLSNGRIWVPKLVVEWLDILLSSLQTGAHLHRHVLVMHHKHPGDIGLDPRSLELLLLPLRQQVIDSVLQLIMIFAVVGGDRLPCSVSYCILVNGLESWTLVTAEHIRSAEDLQDCLVLFLSRAWNSLDSELWRSGYVDAVQQITQSASGDWGFISKGLDLVGVVVHLFLLSVTQRSVVFIIFAFNLISFFFYIILMVVVVELLACLLPQVPWPWSRWNPALEEHTEESRAAALAEVAHPLPPTDQWAGV